MELQKPVVHIIQEVVEQVEANLLASLQAIQPKIMGINYQYGHPLEIIETLAQYDKASSKKLDKYPLFMLVQDFDEPFGVSDGYSQEVNLRIVIAHHTKNTYKAKERYDETFIPILYPILQGFLNELAISKYFLISNPLDIKMDKKDRLYWGKESLAGNTANAFCDYLDAIEITNLRLTLDLVSCGFYINP